MFFDGYGYHGRSFEQTYRCYPASFIDKPQIENGDKIIMPPSALDRLASLHIDYPMLFELRNDSTERVSHCGVLEFIAEEGLIYMPYWMMENLCLQEGDTVTVKNVTLPKGKYVKLQPHTKDFLDISNPKAILETTLRNFSCLTTGDSIMVAYNNKKYYIDIVETKPSNGISIIETDCEVDFAPPLDYKEPERTAPSRPSNSPAEVQEDATEVEPKFNPFTGGARRLDGKPLKQQLPPSSSSSGSSDKQVNATNGGKKSAAAPSSQSSSRQSQGKLVFGSNANRAPEKQKEPVKEEPQKKEEPKFPESLRKRVMISTKPPKEYLKSKEVKEKDDTKKEAEQDDVDEEEDEDEGEDDEEDPKSDKKAASEYKRLIAIHAGKGKGGLSDWLRVDLNKVRRLSLSEPELEKAVDTHAKEIIRFTQHNLLRIYPKGIRVDSSNYDPFVGWMHGAQMVAFNMQGYGRSLWLMHGMFRANGGCGYVKKPDLLLKAGPDNEVFDPTANLPVKTTLKVTVYMGDGWDKDFDQTDFDTYSPPDFYAKLGIAGVPADEVKKRTETIDDNWIPSWNEQFEFPLTVPELALLRIKVLDYNLSDKDEFAGQTCLPVAELRQGIRAVPLYDRKGEKYSSVKLLMHFEFK